MQSLQGELNVRDELFDSWKPAASPEPYTCAIVRCDRTDGWVGQSSVRKVTGKTRGLAHGRAVTVTVATVNRVVEELLEKGHIARPYLGIAMQPLEVPNNVRSKLPC